MSMSKDPEETPNVKSQVVVVLVVPDHDHRCVVLRGAMAAPKRHLYQAMEETDHENYEGALRMVLCIQTAPPEITMLGETPVTRLARPA